MAVKHMGFFQGGGSGTVKTGAGLGSVTDMWGDGVVSGQLAVCGLREAALADLSRLVVAVSMLRCVVWPCGCLSRKTGDNERASPFSVGLGRGIDRARTAVRRRQGTNLPGSVFRFEDTYLACFP